MADAPYPNHVCELLTAAFLTREALAARVGELAEQAPDQFDPVSAAALVAEELREVFHEQPDAIGREEV